MSRAVFHFILRLIIVHVAVYFLVHGLVYEGYLIDLYDNPDHRFPRFIRSPENQTVWSHVWRWILPIQVIRAFLVGIALSPFYGTLLNMKRSKRFLVLFFVLFLIGGWSAYIPGPGSLEGLLHLHPDIHLGFHFAFLPLVLFESLFTSLGVSMWLGRRKNPDSLLEIDYEQ